VRVTCHGDCFFSQGNAPLGVDQLYPAPYAVIPVDHWKGKGLRQLANLAPLVSDVCGSSIMKAVFCQNVDFPVLLLTLRSADRVIVGHCTPWHRPQLSYIQAINKDSRDVIRNITRPRAFQLQVLQIQRYPGNE
jgi:hypothetical protein